MLETGEGESLPDQPVLQHVLQMTLQEWEAGLSGLYCYRTLIKKPG